MNRSFLRQEITMVPQSLQKNHLCHHRIVVAPILIWVLVVWFWVHSFLGFTQALRENGNAIVPTLKLWQLRTWSQMQQVGTMQLIFSWQCLNAGACLCFWLQFLRHFQMSEMELEEGWLYSSHFWSYVMQLDWMFRDADVY